VNAANGGVGKVTRKRHAFIGQDFQFATLLYGVALRANTSAVAALPNFAKACYASSMSTMNISLPDSLKDFVDEQVNQGGYGTSSEYVRELIRKDQDRLRLRGLLLGGARSAQTKPVDDAYFDSLRRKAKAAKRGAAR
jgi:antitoxin ParD1/3/4